MQTDKFGDETMPDQIVRLDLPQHTEIALFFFRLAGLERPFFIFGGRAESDNTMIQPACDDLLQPHERPATDEQDIRRIDRG